MIKANTALSKFLQEICGSMEARLERQMIIVTLQYSDLKFTLCFLGKLGYHSINQIMLRLI
jgi:hypothetical protein